MASCGTFLTPGALRCEGHFIPIPGVRNQEDASEDEKYHLPRSSPVISCPGGLSLRKSHEASCTGSRTHGEPGHPETSQFVQNLEKQSAEDHVTIVQSWPVEEKKAELSCSESEDLSRGSSLSEDMDLNCAAPGLEKERSSGGFASEEEQIPPNIYRTSLDLDQENSHFVVVDMVLEVLETAKWNMVQKLTDCSSFDSGYGELSDHGFCSNRNSSTSGGRCSAGALAQRLLLELGRWWIPTDELIGEFPLVTVSTAPGCEAGLSDEILQRSRMRGTLVWSPPQFQIISSMHQTQRRNDIIASQHFLCAGCGTEVEQRYIKKLRYCDYLGKYFCDCCHSGGESVIPARVLSNWDFGRYAVCQFSKELLESISEKPVFRITDVTRNLYAHAKELQKFREIQEQIISVRKLLSTCRLAEGVLVEFQQLPCHVTQELHLFSIEDLVRIKRGQLIATAKAVMRSAAAHVENCELCQGKGFICEFCRGPDILFPFQTDICTRCRVCRTCFHTSCFRDAPCPKCVRLQARRSLQETPLHCLQKLNY